MSALPALAAGYAIFLALAAALLSRRRARRADAPEWSRAAAMSLHRVIGRTLLVLAAFVLIVAGVKHRHELRSLEGLGISALVVGGIATSCRRRAS